MSDNQSQVNSVICVTFTNPKYIIGEEISKLKLLTHTP